jgi:hypothetical protein
MKHVDAYVEMGVSGFEQRQPWISLAESTVGDISLESSVQFIDSQTTQNGPSRLCQDVAAAPESHQCT